MNQSGPRLCPLPWLRDLLLMVTACTWSDSKGRGFEFFPDVCVTQVALSKEGEINWTMLSNIKKKTLAVTVVFTPLQFRCRARLLCNCFINQSNHTCIVQYQTNRIRSLVWAQATDEPLQSLFVSGLRPPFSSGPPVVLDCVPTTSSKANQWVKRYRVWFNRTKQGSRQQNKLKIK